MPLPFCKSLCSILSALAMGMPAWAGSGELRISGSGSGLAVLKLLGQRFEKSDPGTRVRILPSIGSSGGIRAVADGKLDLACSSRSLNAEEAARGIQEHTFASSPMVFAVQKSNPAAELEFSLLLGMYEGRVLAWPSGLPVRVVLRPKSDTAHGHLSAISKAMAAAVDKAHTRPGAIVAMTDQENADQLEKSPGSLGSLTLGQLLSEMRALKPLPWNGIQPTLENQANGTYPFSIPLILFFRKDPGNPEAARFLQFLETLAAKEILRKNGFLPASARSSRGQP